MQKSTSDHTFTSSNPYPNFINGDAVATLTVLQIDLVSPRFAYSPSFTNALSANLTLNGSRYRDFCDANTALGHYGSGGRSRAGYTLHHCYNPAMTNIGDYTMQEINRTTHRQTCPHTGAFAQGHYRRLYAPLDFDGFSHLSELTALGNKSFDKEFEILENKLGFKLSDKMKQFYNKMGFTGRPDRDIRIKIKKPDGNLFDSDLGWLYPLDLEDSNGIYKVIQEKHRFIEEAKKIDTQYNHNNAYMDSPEKVTDEPQKTEGEKDKSEPNIPPNYIPFAETSGGDIYFVKSNRDGSIYRYDSVIFYEHEYDECYYLTEDLIELYDICVI